MYDTQKIANRIKIRTKLLGINLKEMLSTLDLGINAISHLSKGQIISSINLARIADYLDCSVDYLLGRTDIVEVNRETKTTNFENLRMVADTQHSAPPVVIHDDKIRHT